MLWPFIVIWRNLDSLSQTGLSLLMTSEWEVVGNLASTLCIDQKPVTHRPNQSRYIDASMQLHFSYANDVWWIALFWFLFCRWLSVTLRKVTWTPMCICGKSFHVVRVSRDQQSSLTKTGRHFPFPLLSQHFQVRCMGRCLVYTRALWRKLYSFNFFVVPTATVEKEKNWKLVPFTLNAWTDENSCNFYACH